MRLLRLASSRENSSGNSCLDRHWDLRTPSHAALFDQLQVKAVEEQGSRNIGWKQNAKHHPTPAKIPLWKVSGRGKHPTWWGSVAIQQVVVLCGVEVHDDAGSIQQLLVTAGTGDAVVAVPAVASVVQLLWLHLATHRSPEQGDEKERWVWGCRGFTLSQAKFVYCW